MSPNIPSGNGLKFNPQRLSSAATGSTSAVPVRSPAHYRLDGKPTSSNFLTAFFAGCAFLGALTTLIGWFGNLPRLTDWIVTDIPMFANTAFAAFLSAAALLLTATRRELAINIIRCLALLVATIGAASLFENLSGINLGIDTILVNPTYGHRAANVPGRMGIPASMSYLLIGVGLLSTSGTSRTRRFAPTFAIAVLAICTLSIVGYLFNADPLFSITKYTAIAFQTAIIMFCLAVALFASTADVEPLRTLSGQTAAGALARRAIPFALIVPALVGWLFVVVRRLQVADRGSAMASLVLILMLSFCALLAWCVRDVKRHEVELRRKNGQLAAFLETAAIGLHRVGPDGKILWANDAEMKMLGYAPHEYIGHHITEFHADQPVINDILKHLTCGDKLCNCEARLKCKDGSIKHVLIDSSVLWENGAFIHTQCFTRDVTASKQAADALRDNERRLSQLIEAMPAAVYTTDAEGRITMFNQAAVDLSGRVPQIGCDKWCISWKLYHPDGKPLPHDQFPMALALKQGRSIRGHEAIAERPDGTRVNFMPFPTPLRDNEGNVVGGINMMVDITERKRAEEASARLAAIVEGTSDAIVSKDLNGNIQTWNKGAERIFGYTADEVIGRPVTMLFPPGREHDEPGILEKIRNGEMIHDFETVRRRKDGTLLDVSLTISPIRNSSGQIIGASKILRDITERKRAEQILDEERRILETLNRTGAAIASQLDLQTLVQTVTDAATEVSGAKFGAFFYNVINPQGEAYLLYTLSGAPREAFEKFGMPRNTPVFAPTFAGQGVIRSADITKDPRYGKMAPHHGMPKGHLPVCSYLAVPVISRSGEVIGGLFFGHPEPNVFTERSEKLIVGIASQAAVAIDNARLYDTAQREIIQRKRVEQELQKAKDSLEEQVEARTASLKETTQQLETFCYTIAHDLRSPLRAQQNYAEIILSDYKHILDAAGCSYADRIIKSAQRLDRLVTDLLTYSRLSREELLFGNVDLALVVSEIQTTLSHEIQASRANLQMGEMLPVYAYAPTVNLVLTNLVSNALKFVEPGKAPQLYIWSERRGGFVRIWVEDNGIGIAGEYIDKIFGVFQRLHAMDQYPGTGIGLAIVQKGVERMGGRAGVESIPNDGSKFWIELPAAK